MSLSALREQMKEMKLDAFLVPTADFHQTETVADHFAARAYLSGFTGSAGFLIVGLEKAALWTDGRYFIQAEKQLEGSGIDLMKMGQEDTPSQTEYLASLSVKRVGMDGRTLTVKEIEDYQQSLPEVEFVLDADLVSQVWTNRPAMPASQTFYFEHSGRTIAQKLAVIREKMAGDGLLLSKLDEVAWVTNMRAHDIEYFPVAYAYLLIGKTKATLYINQARVDETVKTKLNEAGIQLADYEEVAQGVQSFEGCLSSDPAVLNAYLKACRQAWYWQESPVVLLKAIKNEVEIESTKKAHIKDGVALTKFMYWLKHTESMTELSASQKLHDLRMEQEGFLEESFGTISAYGAHAAMMHYHSTPESDCVIEKRGLYLVDSGGQYLEGTTDTTRTFVMGALTEQERRMFTLALKGHIRLSLAKWLYGCRGLNLDILARGPIWDEMLDYQCGTGHGVGHLSCVHEAPNGIRWRIVPERNDSAVLEAGMITSNEPGIYLEGLMGIRHENELLAVNLEKNFYGQFMGFESLTFVPFDVEGIDVDLLDRKELAYLNDYHQKVVEKIGPYLSSDELAWLKSVCAPL